MMINIIFCFLPRIIKWKVILIFSKINVFKEILIFSKCLSICLHFLSFYKMIIFDCNFVTLEPMITLYYHGTKILNHNSNKYDHYGHKVVAKVQKHWHCGWDHWGGPFLKPWMEPNPCFLGRSTILAFSNIQIMMVPSGRVVAQQVKETLGITGW